MRQAATIAHSSQPAVDCLEPSLPVFCGVVADMLYLYRPGFSILKSFFRSGDVNPNHAVFYPDRITVQRSGGRWSQDLSSDIKCRAVTGADKLAFL